MADEALVMASDVTMSQNASSDSFLLVALGIPRASVLPFVK